MSNRQYQNDTLKVRTSVFLLKDDLKVNHELSDIVAGSDYYPFGLKMDGREITRKDFSIE